MRQDVQGQRLHCASVIAASLRIRSAKPASSSSRAASNLGRTRRTMTSSATARAASYDALQVPLSWRPRRAAGADEDVLVGALGGLGLAGIDHDDASATGQIFII